MQTGIGDKFGWRGGWKGEGEDHGILIYPTDHVVHYPVKALSPSPPDTLRQATNEQGGHTLSNQGIPNCGVRKGYLQCFLGHESASGWSGQG